MVWIQRKVEMFEFAVEKHPKKSWAHLRHRAADSCSEMLTCDAMNPFHPLWNSIAEMMAHARWCGSRGKLRCFSFWWRNNKSVAANLVSGTKQLICVLKHWLVMSACAPSMLWRNGLQRRLRPPDGVDPKSSWDVWVCSGERRKAFQLSLSQTRSSSFTF